MTKAQLEQQKAREAQGLPSNEDEAMRVVALEQQVSQMADAVSKILQAVQGGGAPAQPMPQYPPLVTSTPPPFNTATTQFPESSVARPLTPQELPAGYHYTREGQVVEIRGGNLPTSPPAVNQMGTPPLGLASAPGASTPPQPQPPMTPEAEDAAYGAMNESLYESDPNVPASAAEALQQSQAGVGTSSPATTRVGAEVEKQQRLFDAVVAWLGRKDVHKLWRLYTASLSRQLAYNQWPQAIQRAFDERFAALLRDGTFVSTLCGRLVTFATGHLITDEVAGRFVLVMAGMIAFGLVDIPNEQVQADLRQGGAA